jgi:hypothetical protein
MADEAKGDGINREGLAYRAGWVEALRAFGQQIQIYGVRAKKNEVAGLTAASLKAKEMYDAMLAKMKAGPSDNPTPAPK